MKGESGMGDETSSSQSFLPQYEESWWETPEGKEAAQAMLKELEEELAQQDPVRQLLRGVMFNSWSKGLGKKNKKGQRKRRLRKQPRQVILLRWNDRWRIWTGEDRTDKGRVLGMNGLRKSLIAEFLSNLPLTEIIPKTMYAQKLWNF